MSEHGSKSVIMSDAVVEGDVVSKGQLVVNGRLQGSLTARQVTISKTGELYGKLRAEDADVHGALQGDVVIRGLIRIGETGAVAGDVVYGKISMDKGGELSATLRNVPPHLAGDFNVAVKRGGVVVITTDDLTALDPDDVAADLVYSVTKPAHGFVALASASSTPVTRFTQADLEAAQVIFVHDGSSEPAAGFDTLVADAKGATSGKTRHVSVIVKG
ncbi:MAG: polymer-forming cytoskeletal protein [Hyphomicrobiaceae bacterium]|nr:polymer-forming cytoskeletal protein [Hyphomicrobiaceae bacterium]